MQDKDRRERNGIGVKLNKNEKYRYRIDLYCFFLSDRIFLVGDKKCMGVIGIDIYPKLS